uniref:ABC transporter domain-containing protein n=1 Tax=viral metagenome TaxID=1070528 RepID=A0A6C0D2W8_9ZZZZ
MISIHELLIQFTYTHKFTVISYLLVTIISYPLINIYIPDYYGKVISSFKDGHDLVYMVKMLLLLYVIGRIFDELVLYCQYLILPNFSEYITSSIFGLVVNHFNYDFENIKIGEIISKLTKMPDILFNYSNLFRIDFLKQLFIYIAAIGHYSSISKTIVTVFCIFIVIHYIYFFVMLKYFYGCNKKVNIFQDNVYENLNDTMQNISSVYSLNQQEYEKKRFYEYSFADYKEIFGETYIYYLWSFGLWAIVNIAMFVILNYILYISYKKKLITSNQLVSSFVITWSILGVYQKAIDSAWDLSEVYGTLYNVEDYFNDLAEKNKSLKPKTEQKSFKDGDIIISGVYHKYKHDAVEPKQYETIEEDSDNFVLENISMTIKKGEKVAFIGKIGSGKSTLVKLIMGYQPLVMGSITIGGVSVNDMTDDDIRKNIFYIPQKPKLFNRTLYENIVYGMTSKPSKEKILDIMKLYDIHFKMDLDEKVGVEGNSVSGGQRQMVWLLRALLHPASILIMDEPTSALDPTNKQLINSIIKKTSVQKTVIIVSHDKIDSSFRKIRFEDGKLTEYDFDF